MIPTYKVGDHVVLVHQEGRRDWNADLPIGSVGIIRYVYNTVKIGRTIRVSVEWEGFHNGHSYTGGPDDLDTVWDVYVEDIEHARPFAAAPPTDADLAGLFGGVCK